MITIPIRGKKVCSCFGLEPHVPEFRFQFGSWIVGRRRVVGVCLQRTSVIIFDFAEAFLKHFFSCDTSLLKSLHSVICSYTT